MRRVEPSRRAFRKVGLRQIQKLGTALGRNNFGRLQKVNQALPGQFPVGESFVNEIEGESTAQQSGG
ncbi:MAG: hypothetical protein DMG55_07450 [Acidobacteria bacterium]|nr:MAG: hypothetical protein DMG55_07450 [Acidobacteriota bacterium]